jgi:hypothetical protein
VTPGNVEHLFADAGVPERLDVLSIDVEGSDHPIWDALQGYRPRVVVIAYGSALPADTRLVQPDDHGWQPTDFEGAPLDALVRLGTEKGYRLVHTETSGVTAFFVPAELADGRFPAPEMIPTRQPRDVQNGYRHPTHANGHRHVSIGSGQLVSASTKATH